MKYPENHFHGIFKNRLTCLLGLIKAGYIRRFDISGFELFGDEERKAKELNVAVVMSRDDHPSITDRILETAELLQVPEDTIGVNIQGPGGRYFNGGRRNRTQANVRQPTGF